ncbi:MAG: AbrB/MazE/SpoVT family DNA-binding domain-containing protein [Chitinophagaceae bacterium]|jgi:antitoxin MazE|nr:AbrB/MazE/SpoVT family DNA-binding domain-containing protein [Chitinophagaceae bacterium]
MITTLTNFGDSLGVRFPKSFLKNMPISENDDVEIFVTDDSIIIKRPERKKHLTTKERIAAFSDTPEFAQLSETDWGKPQGKEVW